MVSEGMFATGAVGSYCTVDDVMDVISAYELEDDETVRERIRRLLNQTKSALDTVAGRDFLRHENETKLLDGSGTRTLTLAGHGVHPPVEVSGLSVNGRSIESWQWRYYPSANSLRLRADACLQSFPEGVQNIRIELTWGYEQPPDDIARAQAKLTAAELLSDLGGDAEAVEALRLGDYSVRYSSGGRYGADIARLVDEARQTARKYRGPGMVSV